jgi:hypothetical protein
MNYKKFEYHTAYMEEKRELLQKYNTQNGTLYHFYYECIHKEYIGGTTSTELANFFDISITGIRKQLQRMGVPLESHGGCKKPKLTITQIREIRASKEPRCILAKRYNYDPVGISEIKRGKRWKNIK